LRPSAATSSGALSLRPSASATMTPCSPRSTDGDARLPQQPGVLARLGARAQRGAQVAVLVHPAERLVVVGSKCSPPGSSPSATAIVADRAAGLGR
jgi:hypothetical protein